MRTSTSPVSGRYSPFEVRSDISQLTERFVELRAHDSGYLEVRREADHPVMTLGFDGSQAVVQLMKNEQSTWLLLGDGSTASPVELPVMDESMDVSHFDLEARAEMEGLSVAVANFFEAAK